MLDWHSRSANTGIQDVLSESYFLGNHVEVYFVSRVPSLSDEPDIFAEAKAGDPQAFQALVRPHLDSIRRFARSFCKNDSDADDLAQDALVKAYRSFGSQMTSAHDPLHAPLRLLREASLPTCFEERLAERLAAEQQRGTVVRFPGRRRVLLLVAAIAIPALAAAAGGYYVQRRAAAASSESAPKQVEAKAFGHLPKTGFTVTVPRTEPAMPEIKKLPAPRSQEPSRPSNLAPKAEVRRPNRPEPEKAASPPAANAAPRIEALDPFVAKSTTSKQSSAMPKAANVSESLRKATEQGAARTIDDSARGSRRDANANENRGNDAVQQAHERVQARERKGQ